MSRKEIQHPNSCIGILILFFQSHWHLDLGIRLDVFFLGAKDASYYKAIDSTYWNVDNCHYMISFRHLSVSAAKVLIMEDHSRMKRFRIQKENVHVNQIFGTDRAS